MPGRVRALRPLALFGATAAVVIAAAAIFAAHPEASPAAYRVAQVSPDTPPVDVYVDGVLVETGMAYGRIGEMRSAGRSGAVLIAVRLAGTSPETLPLLSAEVYLTPGVPTVIAIANTLEHLQIGAYPIPLANVPADRARIHVIHAIPGAPRIGVRAEREIVTNELGYLEDPPFRDVMPGPRRVIGFTSVIPATLIFDQDRPLEPGAVETIILTGYPLQAIFITTRPG